MKHFYLTSFAFLITMLTYSQTDVDTKETIELKKKKKRVELTIKSLTDSLNKIELKIAELKSEKVKEKIKDSSVTTLIRKGAKLKKEASLFSEIITIFNEDKKGIILDYNNEYFQVCQGNLCGYIHEGWIIQNDLISELKKVKETERKNIGKTNNNLYSQKALSNTKSNNNQFKEKRQQNSRTYYSGPRGGCYYINSNGNKTYVSRSLCN
ncbi:hypothetical protein AAGV33_14720 [Flavobacterium sp. FBOR7N2.3]|uniref:SH3 domain-containing protein n=1 Tax=Flavobacterium magnesitis TaxID=3138077 RepID=A0ABV4TPB7_9FLAO